MIEARKRVEKDREEVVNVLLEIMDGLLSLDIQSRWTVERALQHLRKAVKLDEV